MFSLIAAIGKNNELGKDGDLCFHLKKDMEFFKNKTSGHTVVMGHKTWDSLPKKLKNRKNIVISRHDFSGPDQIIHDLDQFIKENLKSHDEIFIIGGGTVYYQFLPYAKTVYLTEIDATDPSATTFFPEFDKTKYDKIVLEEGEEDGFKYAIIQYNRRQNERTSI